MPQEELDKELKGELISLLKLKKAYQKGKISKEEAKKKREAIWEKIEKIKEEKLDLYEEEKARLEKELEKTGQEVKEGKINDWGYFKKKEAIEGFLDQIEDEITLMDLDIGKYMEEREKRKKEELKKPVDERPGKPDYYLFPLSLWIVVGISGAITAVILLMSFILGISAMGALPLRYGGMFLGSMILGLFFAVIVALIVAGILMFSALIAGVYPERISYKKSLIAVIAEAVTIIGLSTIFSVGLGLFGFVFYLSSIAYYLLYISSLGFYLAMGSWIIRSIFYTTWKKAVITWVIKTVVIFALYMLVLLALGARINLF